MHFNNKIVWITGGSSGIGAALAEKLARKGARLILTSRNIDALRQVQSTCLKFSKDCKVLPADLTDANAIEKLVADAIGLYGHLDIVILNAGVTQRSLAIDTDLKVYRQLMEINFFAPISITKYLLPHFARRQSGQIVAISSMAGLMGFPMRTGYAAAKHALQGYFETLQTEHTIPGFSITIISPGRINTPISQSALTADGSPHNSMDKGQLEGIPVEICVDRILMAATQKRKHLIIAKGERILLWIKWFIPPLYYKIAHKKGLE